MKFCEVCGVEIDTRDGENRCSACEDRERDTRVAKAKRGSMRRAREQALRDCGLVKVRGALGGVYWE